MSLADGKSKKKPPTAGYRWGFGSSMWSQADPWLYGSDLGFQTGFTVKHSGEPFAPAALHGRAFGANVFALTRC